MQNHGSVCADAVARIDQSYWFSASKKRLAAAEEALDRLEATPELRPAVELTRTLTGQEPEAERRIPLLRESLSRIGAETSLQAAGQTSFLAQVALAAVGPEPPSERYPLALRMVAASVPDDLLARVVEREAGGRSGLQMLAEERPAEPLALARWASGPATGRLPSPARIAVQETLLADLQGLPGSEVLRALGEFPVLQPGLAELGRPGSSPLSVAAATLPLVSLAGRCQAEEPIVASLSPEWRAMAAPWLQAASSSQEKGALLRGLAEGALRNDRLRALQVAHGEHPLSERLAETALDSLSQGDYPGFKAWCQARSLPLSKVVGESLAVLEGKLTEAEAVRRAGAQRPDLMAEGLRARAPGEPFVESLARMAPAQESLHWMLEAEKARPADPGQALKACGGRVETLPPDVLRQVLDAWAPLATSPEQSEKLRLAGSDHEALRQAALKALDGKQTALAVISGALRSSREPAAVGRAAESFLPKDWRAFASRLTAQKPEEAVQGQIYAYCFEKAAQGKNLEPLPLLSSLLSQKVPDALGDSIFRALHDAQDAAGQERLDGWLKLSRKLKLDGDACARGAVRLLSDPNVTAGLVASDAVTRTRDPRSTLELLRWEAERAGQAGEPKQEAYLSAFVAGCEAAFTDGGRDKASLAALSSWRQLPQPKTLQQAVAQLSNAVQSSGDTVQGRAGLARALPLLKPLCQDPLDESLLDLLSRTSSRTDFSDPTGQSGVILRAAGYLERARQAQGNPLAFLGLNMLASSHEDVARLGRDVLEAMRDDARRQGDKGQEEVARFFLDLESWLPPHELSGVQRAGLTLLSGRKPTLHETMRGTSWPTVTSRMMAQARYGENLASGASSPLERHQGALLRKLADLPVETLDLRANSMNYAFGQIGQQPQAHPMRQLWLMGQAAMGQAGNGTQCLRIAQVTCDELQGLAQDTAKTMEAEFFGVMARVLALELPHTDDRYYLAQAFLGLEPGKDPQDISRIGSILAHLAGKIQESSLPTVTRTLLDGLATACRGWGDTKVLLPLLERASQTLSQECTRAKVQEVARELTGALAGYKENYWLVVAAQGGPRSQVQEKDDAVIVGGVRVAKNRSEGD